MNDYYPSCREVEEVESLTFLGHPTSSSWHIPCPRETHPPIKRYMIPDSALEAEICLASKFTHTQICLCTYAEACVHTFIYTQINRPRRKQNTTWSHSHREAEKVGGLQKQKVEWWTPEHSSRKNVMPREQLTGTEVQLERRTDSNSVWPSRIITLRNN